MADETKKVEYAYEGDVKSLKVATKAAIDLLSQYSDAMNKASSTETFTASQRATKSMNASISKLNKDLTKMQDKLKSVGDVQVPRGSATSKAVGDTFATVVEQLQKLNSQETVTTKTLNNFKAQMDAVRSSLQQTSPQVDKLIASELRFQKTLSTVQAKADKFRETMTNMQTRLSKVFDPISARLKSFSKMFDPITAKVQSFKDRASIAFSRVSQLTSAVASAFRRVSQSEDAANNAANKVAKSHNVLSATIGKLTSKLKSITSALSSKNKAEESEEQTSKKSVSSKKKLSQALSTLINKLKSTNSNTKLLSSSMGNLNSVSGLLRKTFGLISGVAIGDMFAKAAKESISFVENLNLFAVAMGESLDEGLAFVDTMSELYGMDPSNLYRYAGYFYQLTDAIGMSSEASKVLSLSMTKASNDIASLFNIPIQDVVEDLASGMQGMSRAVRKYGMDIRATTLQQTALKYGLTEQVETMSEANRMALRYITMMEQVSNATQQVGVDASGTETIMGDFARTIETPANQLRIFKEQITQLGRAIGNFIMAPIGAVLPYINGFIMALRTAINFFGGLLGLLNTSPDTVNTGEIVESVDAIGTAAEGASEKLQSVLAPFDELNILQDQASAGGFGPSGTFDDVLDPALQDAIENMEIKLDNIQMKANEVRDAILKLFGLKVDASGNATAIVGGFVDQIVKAWQNQDYTLVGSMIATFLNQGLYWAIENLSWDVLGAGIQQNVDVITGLYNGFMADYDWKALGTVLGNGVNVAIYTGLDFIRSLDWAVGGLAMAEGFNSVVAAIDWGALAQTISEGMIGILESVYTFLENTDWEAIGVAVKDFLVNIDWGGVAEATFRAIGAAFGALVSFLWGLIKEAWSQVVDWWYEQAYEDGKFTIGGLLQGILDVFANIGRWIKEHIFDPFIKGFKNVFGIHSPSTVMAEMGRYLLDGLFNGLANIGSRIWNWGSDLIDGLKDVLGIHSPSKEFEAIGEYSLRGLFNGFSSLDDITAMFQAELANMQEYAKAYVNYMLGIVSGMLSGMLSALAKASAANKQFLEEAKAAYESMARASISKIQSIISELEAIPNSVKTVHTIVARNITNGIDSIGRNIGVPRVATGGGIISPTASLVRGVSAPESVASLGNSTQVQDLAEEIANAVKRDNPTPQPIHVHVYIGNEQVEEYVHEAEQFRELQTNGGT